jgi:hypothetical protein
MPEGTVFAEAAGTFHKKLARLVLAGASREPAGALAALLLAASCVHAEEGPAAELLKKGDRLDAQFRSTDAMGVFLEAEKLDPNNVEIL